MKQLFLSLVLCSFAFSQSNFGDFMTTISSGGANSNLRMEGKTWTFASIDTTAPQKIGNYGTVVLGLMTTDTVVVTTKYQLSMDGTNWSAATASDSLKWVTGNTTTTKGITFSTIALGQKYIRFLLTYNKSNVYGSTTYTSTARKVWAFLKVSQ